MIRDRRDVGNFWPNEVLGVKLPAVLDVLGASLLPDVVGLFGAKLPAIANEVEASLLPDVVRISMSRDPQVAGESVWLSGRDLVVVISIEGAV